jgi:hypothetical protein
MRDKRGNVELFPNLALVTTRFLLFALSIGFSQNFFRDVAHKP